MRIEKIEGNMHTAGNKIVIHAEVEPEDVAEKNMGYVYVSVRKENDGYPMSVRWVDYKGGIKKEGTMKRFTILFVLLAAMALTASSYIITFNGQIAKDAQGNILTTMTAVEEEITWDIRSKVVAQYKMNDNAANTTVVESIAGNHGELIGGDNTDAKDTTGVINGALQMNGSDDYININALMPSLASLTAGEINFWVYNAAWASGDVVFGVSRNTDNNSYLYARTVNSGGIKFQVALVKDDSVRWSWLSTGVVNTTWNAKWVNIRIVHDGSSNGIIVYANNQLIAGSFSTTTEKAAWFKSILTDATSDAENMCIESFIINASRSGFGGTIYDNYLFTNTALSSDEATYIYNAGNGTEELYG